MRSSANRERERRYEILWSSPAKKSLARLPAKGALAALAFVHSRLADNPRARTPLGVELEGVFSARLGDFRILFGIDDPRRRVTVLEVTHRSDVYRSR